MKSQAVQSIDSPYYRYWQAWYLSFFSGSLYVDVGKRWKGFGFVYLLLLFALLAIPVTFKLIENFDQFTKRYLDPLESIPMFMIQNGKVIFDKPMPYFVKNYLGEDIVIIDTTGAITPQQINTSDHYPNVTQLVTVDRIYQRNPPMHISGATDTIDNPFTEEVFTNDDNMVFNGINPQTKKTLSYYILFSKIAIYPMVVLLVSSLLSGIFFMVGMMAQLFSSQLLRHYLSFKQCIRLLSVSATPALVLATLNYMLHLKWVNNGYLIPGVMLVYFCYAVLTLKNSSQTLVR